MLNFTPLSLGRTTFRGSLFTAIFIATALTFSCSSGDDENPGGGTSSPSGGGGTSSPSGGGGGDPTYTYGSVTYEGKTYKTKKIGTQTWMAENMNHAVNGSKCYDDKPANCDKYGRLYDWATAKTVCPSGWHLPSKDEWDALNTFIESDKSCSNCDAKHLKATSDWNNNGNGLDTYGFAALPGGYGNSDGSFYNAGDYGSWWSATESDSNFAYSRIMHYVSEGAYWSSYGDKSGLLMLSVRCLQD